jgi:cytochrome P450 family 9
MIKQITVKEFDHFVNHALIIDENVDRLFGRSLLILRDQKWRDMRATLRLVSWGSCKN